MHKRIKEIFRTDNRIFGLDLMRFIAIILVVQGHSRWMIANTFPKPVKALLHGSGILGVELFFVLSGFLIGGILLKQYEKNNFSLDFKAIQNFWIRRWLRTLPNYYFILIIYLIVFYTDRPEGIWRYFIFVQNFWNHPPSFFEESWSLCIEELSYLISPLFLGICTYIFGKNGKGNGKLFLYVSIALIVLITLLRAIYSEYFLPQYFNDEKYKWSHHFREVGLIRLDSIYYGFIAAYIAFNYQNFWKKNGLALLIIGIIGIVVLMASQQLLIEKYSGTLTNTLFFTFLSISIAFIIPYLSEIKQLKYGYIAKPITAVSIISYSLYLINGGLISENIKRFTEEGKDWNFSTSLFVYIGYWLVCLILSALIFVFFEKPMTDLRNKFK